MKYEGEFLLRYRVFDLFSLPRGHRDIAIQAECYGAAFRIYTTKDFPGLPPSTALTKVSAVGYDSETHADSRVYQELARVGVRLSVRDTGKKATTKRRKRSDSFDEDDSS